MRLLRHAVICLAGLGSTVVAQVIIPPGVAEQVNDSLGGEVETVAIIGSESSLSGGFYKTDFDNTALEINKFAFRLEVLDPIPLGRTPLKWSPSIQVAMGTLSSESQFDSGPLLGNSDETFSFVAQSGLGVRLYLSDYVSSATTLGLIYSRRRDRFTANNAFGQFVKDNLSGVLVDLDIHTLTLAPTFDLRYERWFGFMKLRLDTDYKYFRTGEIVGSGPVVDIRSQSHTWRGRADLEFRTPLRLWGGPIKIGGSMEYTQIWGGIRKTVEDDHVWGSTWRVFWDPHGRFWIFTGLGFAGGRYWSDTFEGTTFGVWVDARL